MSCCTNSLNAVGALDVATECGFGLRKALHILQQCTVAGIIFSTPGGTPAALRIFAILSIPAWYHRMCNNRRVFRTKPLLCDLSFCIAFPSSYLDQSMCPPCCVAASRLDFLLLLALRVSRESSALSSLVPVSSESVTDGRRA